MSERHDQAQADIDFLVQRAMKAGSFGCSRHRDTGISSNSLVLFAYRPDGMIEMPHDRSDLAACVRAYRKLPKHRKTAAVRDALSRQRAAIGRKV